MSTPSKTPSPHGAPPIASNAPMAPPATPSARSPSMTPATPGATTSSPAPHTPGTTTSPASVPRTPGGSGLKACSSDPGDFVKIKIHTAKCTECDKRNETDEMLRCPGCGWQICVPCQEKRAKRGRDLMHGGMGTPGGLLGLRSGGVSKRRTLGAMKSPAPSSAKEVEASKEDVEMTNTVDANDGKGKGKAKPTAGPKAAPKKRPAKSKAKPMHSDESSDDDFAPDPSSPTSHKRRRTTIHITDTPTATSARPHRRPAPTTTSPTYIAASSPSSDGSSSDVPAEIANSMGRRPTTLNHSEMQRQWNIDIDKLPTGRIHELLRENGVDVPGHRYEQHFLERHEPVVSSPTIAIPDAVRRMGDAAPRLSAVEKVNLRNKAAMDSAAHRATISTVRHFASTTALQHSAANPHLSADETQELSNAVKESARRWATRTHAKLPAALQRTVERSLDMRLDHVDAAYGVQLERLLQDRAASKLREFEEERRAVGMGGEEVDGEAEEQGKMAPGDKVQPFEEAPTPLLEKS